MLKRKLYGQNFLSMSALYGKIKQSFFLFQSTVFIEIPLNTKALCEELYINALIEFSQQTCGDYQFRDDKTMAKRNEVTCSKSYCWQEAELGFVLRSVSSSNSSYSTLWHPRNYFSFSFKLFHCLVLSKSINLLRAPKWQKFLEDGPFNHCYWWPSKFAKFLPG